MKTIYVIILFALMCATTLFIMSASLRWKARKSIKERIMFCIFNRKDKEEINRHKVALTGCTFDAIEWTAISIGGLYACIDCAISLANTL